MFKLRMKNSSYQDWIEFRTASEFYDFLNTKYLESSNEQWQWYDSREWKPFSDHYVKGDKKKLWFI